MARFLNDEVKLQFVDTKNLSDIDYELHYLDKENETYL